MDGFGISVEDANNLDWGVYQAMLWTLNDRRKDDTAEDAPPPSADRVQRNLARIPASALGRPQ